MTSISGVLVTGGAGYVGSALVPALLVAGYRVTVLDLYMYGKTALDEVRGHPNLTEIEGDMRDPAAVARAVAGCEAVLHLACISNDPSFELNPELGKSINLDALRPLIRAAKAAGVRRFVYASSSSVYGVKTGQVTEEVPLEPLTDYSRFKALGERILLEEREPGFETLSLRPATVCGYAPRQRLDVIVNILTNHAVNAGRICVMGGEQMRPNIHIADMVSAYLLALSAPAERIDGKVFNVGYENYSVRQLAEIVKAVVERRTGRDIALDVVPTDDNRSYHVCSDRICEELGFVPKHNIEQAVEDLVDAFQSGKLPDAMNDRRYFNIKTMQARELN